MKLIRVAMVIGSVTGFAAARVVGMTGAKPLLFACDFSDLDDGTRARLSHTVSVGNVAKNPRSEELYIETTATVCTAATAATACKDAGGDAGDPTSCLLPMPVTFPAKDGNPATTVSPWRLFQLRVPTNNRPQLPQNVGVFSLLAAYGDGYAFACVTPAADGGVGGGANSASYTCQTSTPGSSRRAK